jgi:hypothetical protein
MRGVVESAYGRCVGSTVGFTGLASQAHAAVTCCWLIYKHTHRRILTLLPAAQACVTALATLPGGWLLASGDADGGLSCTDLRMMGGSSGAPARPAAGLAGLASSRRGGRLPD